MIDTNATQIDVLSPAKINLFLQITGRRSDGYHLLKSLMCRISLYDRIKIDLGGSRISVACSHPDVPEDESNLAYRAAVKYLEHIKMEQGMSIAIDKKIPVSAGLGGGSSNAAAVLMALNQYFKKPVSDQKLMEIGLLLGADVPYFIYQKPAIATGVGEQLQSYKNLTPLYILLIFPGFSVSTRSIYKKVNLRLTKCKNNLKTFNFKTSQFDLAHHLCNDLEAITTSCYPEVKIVKQYLLDLGADGVIMSGSGPTVAGFYKDRTRAEMAYKNMFEGHVRWQKYQAEIIL